MCLLAVTTSRWHRPHASVWPEFITGGLWPLSFEYEVSGEALSGCNLRLSFQAVSTSPKGKPVPPRGLPLFPRALRPWQPPLCSLLLRLSVLAMSHKWDPAVCSLLNVTFIMEHAFEVYWPGGH